MDNKTKIMEMALELFSYKGYNGTGIQEIVDKSGIGKPTMYYYFGNKEGVLEAILRNYLEPFIEKLKNEAEYNRDVTLSITLVVKCFFAFARQYQNFYRMFISMSSEAPGTIANQKIIPYVDEIYAIIEELFLNASEQHGNMKGRHREYALTLMGILNTYGLLIINKNIEITDHLIYRVVHQFMHGIFS